MSNRDISRRAFLQGGLIAGVGVTMAPLGSQAFAALMEERVTTSPQKWMNFYTKVLSRFATGGGLKITVSVDVEPPAGITMAKIEETQVALRELGLSEDTTLRRR